MQQYLSDPRYLVIGALVLALIVLAVAFFIIRAARRRREETEQSYDDLMANERQLQLEAAVDNIPFLADPGAAAKAIVDVFRQYLSVKVLGVYAGRTGARLLTNVLTDSASATGSLRSESLIPQITEEFLRGYTRPRMAPRSDFTVMRAAPDSGFPAGEAPAPYTAGVGGQPAQVQQAASGSSPGPQTRPLGVLPWRGPFAWRGIVLIDSLESIHLEGLAPAFEEHGQISSRLAVSLELSECKAGVQNAGDQAGRLPPFVEFGLKALAAGTGLNEVLKSVAELLGADSAAYWKLDSQTNTVSMVSGFGLKSAEFLPVPIGQGFSGRVAQDGQALAVEDAPSDPRCLFPNEAKEAGIGSYLGVPAFGAKKLDGVLEVHTIAKRVWEPTAVGSLTAAGRIVAAVSEKASEPTTVDLSVSAGASLDAPPASREAGAPQAADPSWLRAESAYMTLTDALGSLKSRDEVLEAAVELVGHALGATRVIAVELDATSSPGRANQVKHEFRASELPSAAELFFPPEFASRIFAEAKTRASISITDSANESLMPVEILHRLQAVSELAAPIKVNEEVRALLYVLQCDTAREWAKDEVGFAERVARQVSLSLTNIRALDKAGKELESVRGEAHRAIEIATRARGLIDAIPEAIIGLDRQGRLTFFNSSARSRYRLKNEDLGIMVETTEALALSDDSVWDQVNASEAVIRFEALIAAPKAGAQLAAPDRPKQGKGKLQGATVPVSIAVAPIRNEKAEITGRIVVLTDLSHMGGAAERAGDKGSERAASRLEEERAAEGAQRISDMQQKIGELESALSEAHRVIETAAAADAAGARVPVGPVDLERVRADEARARRAAQQLLEINRLKSDFIVNAGRELDASLQSVLGFAELLGQGQYGQLTPEQMEAARGIYAWARRMKNDVDWLIEYGSTRSRVLEPGEAGEGGEGAEAPERGADS